VQEATVYPYTFMKWNFIEVNSEVGETATAITRERAVIGSIAPRSPSYAPPSARNAVERNKK